jgi:hypothetical protein
MAWMAKEKLVKTAKSLVVDGEHVAAVWANIEEDGGSISGDSKRVRSQWEAGCKNLLRLLGQAGEMWAKLYDDAKEENPWGVESVRVGIIAGLAEAIENDLLLRIESLVFAEAFSNLLEQAEHLIDSSYFLAAGVLGRAVLEEHLRKWCDKEGCAPTKPRPTMADYYTSLQVATHLTATQVAHVKWMAAVGNDAAHNKPTLTQPDVERLVRDVRDFLVRHPLA